MTVISLNPRGYSANNGICKSVLSIGIPAGLSIFLMNCVDFLRIYIFSIFGIGFLELFNALFQAMGQWKTATVGIVIGKIVLMVPALIIFSKIWNVTGIIAAQPFAETLTVLEITIIMCF